MLLPDLIIMDVSMPNMNGIEVTRIIRAEVLASRILIISQNDLPSYEGKLWMPMRTAF